MAEYIRSVEIKVEIDTNKLTYSQEFTLGENETIDELAERVQEYLNEKTNL